jgi:hypothetical protein
MSDPESGGAHSVQPVIDALEAVACSRSQTGSLEQARDELGRPLDREGNLCAHDDLLMPPANAGSRWQAWDPR